MERRLHPNNNARQAKVTIWIFEGHSLFFLIAGSGLALLAYRYCYDRLGLDSLNSSLAAAVPIALAIWYVAALKLGKPKSYDVDVFRSLGMRFVRVLHRTGVLRSTLDLYAGSGRKSVHPYHEG
jgi:hypothetical protein